MRSLVLSLAILLTWCTLGLADGDVVELRNGDRLSGTITKMDGEKLVITTPWAGDVSVDWKEVSGLSSTSTHWVRLKSGDFVQARLAPAPSGVTLDTGQLQTPQPVPLDRIATIGVPPGARYSGSVAAIVFIWAHTAT
jgi:hypothetical protein